MKKIIALMIALSTIYSLCTPSFAAEFTILTEEAHQTEIERYAYMDIETADPSLLSTITNARNEIILNESWVADGLTGYILDEEGNVINELPHFSELFPEDWEEPTFNSSKTAIGESFLTPYATSNYQLLYEGDVQLKKPSSTTNSTPFCSVSTTTFSGTAYEYYYSSLFTRGYCSDGGTYNIGYANATTGKSLGYATNLTNTQGFQINPPRNITVAIRASSYDIASRYWWMTVYGDVQFVS